MAKKKSTPSKRLVSQSASDPSLRLDFGAQAAVIDAATSGNNTLVAAVSGKKIRVMSCFFICAGAVNVRFESGAGLTALTGQMNFPANGGISLPFNPGGWFETNAGELLNMELSDAVSVDGALTYTLA